MKDPGFYMHTYMQLHIQEHPCRWILAHIHTHPSAIFFLLSLCTWLTCDFLKFYIWAITPWNFNIEPFFIYLEPLKEIIYVIHLLLRGFLQFMYLRYKKDSASLATNKSANKHMLAFRKSSGWNEAASHLLMLLSLWAASTCIILLADPRGEH